MTLPFITEVYKDTHQCVSWSGVQCAGNKQFSGFLKTKVADRFADSEAIEGFNDCLKGLELTGFGKDGVSAILSADVHDERSWSASESLAEAFLEEEYKIVFPWNMERDKRNPYASLPGADIIGFMGISKKCRFVMGEVKSSSENKHPPTAVTGISGMAYQIDELSSNLSKICQLLKWLFIRTENTPHQEKFEQAAENFFNSDNKDIALFGVLIRDTTATEKDLSAMGTKLRKKLSMPTTCNLIALYLPWSINELLSKIMNGEEL